MTTGVQSVPWATMRETVNKTNTELRIGIIALATRTLPLHNITNAGRRFAELILIYTIILSN